MPNSFIKNVARKSKKSADSLEKEYKEIEKSELKSGKDKATSNKIAVGTISKQNNYKPKKENISEVDKVLIKKIIEDTFKNSRIGFNLNNFDPETDNFPEIENIDELEKAISENLKDADIETQNKEVIKMINEVFFDTCCKYGEKAVQKSNHEYRLNQSEKTPTFTKHENQDEEYHRDRLEGLYRDAKRFFTKNPESTEEDFFYWIEQNYNTLPVSYDEYENILEKVAKECNIKKIFESEEILKWKKHKWIGGEYYSADTGDYSYIIYEDSTYLGKREFHWFSEESSNRGITETLEDAKEECQNDYESSNQENILEESNSQEIKNQIKKLEKEYNLIPTPKSKEELDSKIDLHLKLIALKQKLITAEKQEKTKIENEKVILSNLKNVDWEDLNDEEHAENYDYIIEYPFRNLTKAQKDFVKDFKINFNTSEILGTNRDNKKTVYGFNITSKSAPIKNKFKKEAKDAHSDFMRFQKLLSNALINGKITRKEYTKLSNYVNKFSLEELDKAKASFEDLISKQKTFEIEEMREDSENSGDYTLLTIQLEFISLEDFLHVQNISRSCGISKPEQWKELCYTSAIESTKSITYQIQLNKKENLEVQKEQVLKELENTIYTNLGIELNKEYIIKKINLENKVKEANTPVNQQIPSIDYYAYKTDVIENLEEETNFSCTPTESLSQEDLVNFDEFCYFRACEIYKELEEITPEELYIDFEKHFGVTYVGVMLEGKVLKILNSAYLNYLLV